MNEEIVSYVKNYFKDYAMTAELYELTEELAANLTEKYNDLVSEGMDNKAAFESAVGGMGAPEEFIRFMDKMPSPPDAPDIHEEYFPQKAERGFSSIDTLNIDMRSISVVIKNHPGNEIRAEVVQRIKGFPIRAKVTSERQGSVLTIQQKQWDWQALFLGFNDYLEVSLPETYSKTLNIKSRSGNISAEDLNLESLIINNVSGNVRLSRLNAPFGIKVTSGNIKADEISGAGEITCLSGNININGVNSGSAGCLLKCVSGNISVGSFSGSLNAETVSGNIKIPQFEGDGRMKVTSGNVGACIGAITGDCDFSSSSGSVSVTADGIRNFYVEASCGSGIIKTNLKEFVNKHKKQLSVAIGDNPINKMTLRTGSGFLEFNLKENIRPHKTEI